MGIPAVFGVTGAMERIQPGTTLVMDGTRGTVLLSPTPQELAAAQSREVWDKELAGQLEQVVEQPAITTDGVRVTLRGNVDLHDEIRAAQEHRAAGVGLLRTEFLITSRTNQPGEDEQAEYYRRGGGAVPRRPPLIRPHDLGRGRHPRPL